MKNWTSVIKGWTDESGVRIAAVLSAQSKIFSVVLNSRRRAAFLTNSDM